MWKEGPAMNVWLSVSFPAGIEPKVFVVRIQFCSVTSNRSNPDV